MFIYGSEVVLISFCVAFGPGETLERLSETLISLQRQVCTNYEVVLKCLTKADERRIDNLLETKFQNLEIRIYSGKDSGIFDAQNFMVKKAQNKLINFLGCGDKVADDFVVQDIVDFGSYNTGKNIYGPVLVQDTNKGVITLFNLRVRKIKNYVFVFPWENPCHSQGIFYDRQWLLSKPFQLDYGPYSDFYHTKMYGVHKNNFVFINRPISIFLSDGLSSRESLQNFQYRLRAVFAVCKLYRMYPFWVLLSLFYLPMSLIYRKINILK